MVYDEQQYIRSLLTDYFVKASTRNSGFSLRAYAKKLGISSSSLSEIMRSKRKVSAKKAIDFAKRTGASENEVAKIQEMFTRTKSVEQLAKLANPFREVILKPDQFDLLADWRYFGVVALMRTKDFISDRTWIAHRLSLSLKEVDDVLARLMELGIVQRGDDGELIETKCTFRTSQDYPEKLLRQRQIEGLNAAVEILKTEDPRQVGMYSTISTDPSQVPKVGQMIEEFLKGLSIFLHTGEPREVFELQIQIFPRTNQ